MRYLILFLLIYIAGCAAGSDPDEVSYPFQNQTWRVESGDFATWTGVKSAAKFAFADSSADSSGVDTTIISSANGYGLQIVQLQTDTTIFAIEFIDSTYNGNNPAPYSYVDSLFGESHRTVNTKYPGDYAVVSLQYPFECGVNHEPVDTLNWVYAPYQVPEDTIAFYQIVISGALETVNHIICE